MAAEIKPSELFQSLNKYHNGGWFIWTAIFKNPSRCICDYWFKTDDNTVTGVSEDDEITKTIEDFFIFNKEFTLFKNIAIFLLSSKSDEFNEFVETWGGLDKIESEFRFMQIMAQICQSGPKNEGNHGGIDNNLKMIIQDAMQSKLDEIEITLNFIQKGDRGQMHYTFDINIDTKLIYAYKAMLNKNVQ